MFINIQVGVRKLKSAHALSIIATVEEWLQLEVDLTMPVKSVPAKSMIARNDRMLVLQRTPLLLWTDYVAKWGSPECSWYLALWVQDVSRTWKSCPRRALQLKFFGEVSMPPQVPHSDTTAVHCVWTDHTTEKVTECYQIYHLGPWHKHSSNPWQ